MNNNNPTIDTPTNPTPHQAEASKPATSSTRTRPARPTPPTRRHAARRTRLAAAGLSVVATGVLSGVFASQDKAAAATPVASTKSFTGNVATNRWGAVQVKVSVANGKVVDIVTLQLPNSKPKSVRLSNMAVTTMKPAIISAQSTQVNMVSGATMTSRSYAESVQSAIDNARAAGALA